MRGAWEKLKFQPKNLTIRDNLGGLCMNGRLTLKLILNELGGRLWIALYFCFRK